MASITTLKSVAIIEKDVNLDVICAWSFPSLETHSLSLVLNKCCLKRDQNDNDIVYFLYGQYNKQWYYLTTTSVNNNHYLSKVTHFTIVLVTKDFNPERYLKLSKIFQESYLNTGNPTSLLKQYLEVLTKGTCGTIGDEIFDANTLHQEKAFLTPSLKDVISIFGVETILIYTAVLLKKKIVFYSPKIETLLAVTRTIPQLVWHRKNWNILFPFIDLNEETDVENLNNTAFYIAGFTNASVENRTELYDIFANISDGEISISPNAKETFQMGKVHKDIAMFMVNSAKNDEMSDKELVMELSQKTDGLINNLKSLAVDNGATNRRVIKLEVLRERKLTSAMENFLYNLATAEQLV